MQHSYGIDGLRAVAILGVLAFHTGGSWFGGGFVGVDVFFVISGYLITSILISELLNTGNVDFARFYARRFRRLIPAMTLVVVVTVAISFFVFSPVQNSLIARDAWAATFYLSNIYFAFQSTDYLAGDRDISPFLHYWSLGVEEQFYVLWPFLLLITFWLAKSLFSKSDTPRELYVRRVAALVLVVVSIVSFLYSLYLTENLQPMAFFLPFTRVWEFGFGALIALVPPAVWNKYQKHSTGLSIAGFTLILMSFLMLDTGSKFPGWIALFPVIGSFSLLVSFLNTSSSTWFERISSTKLVSLIGRSSYSLYLWHWPFVVFAAHLFSDDPVVKFLATLLSAFPAVLSYKYFENPVHRGAIFPGGIKSGMVIGSAGLAVGAISGLLLYVVSNHLSSDYLGQLVAGLEQDIPIVYEHKCHAPITKIRHDECKYNSSSDAKVEVILFGDSHAAQWFSPLKSITEAKGWDFYSITKSGCSPALVTLWSRRLNRVYTECEKWRETIFERLLSTTDKTRVVIMSSVLGYSTVLNDSGQLAQKEEVKGIWVNGLRETFETLARNPDLVLISLVDTPPAPHDMSVCLSENLHDPEKCDFKIRGKKRLDVKVSNEYPFVRVLDMTTSICPDGVTCPSLIGGLPIYRDNNHMSNSFSKTLDQDLQAALEYVLK